MRVTNLRINVLVILFFIAAILLVKAGEVSIWVVLLIVLSHTKLNIIFNLS